MSSPWKINYSRYKRFFLQGVSQYKKRRELKTYLEMFLSLFTIIIFAVFALRPTLLTIAKLTNEIETKKETVAKMDRKIQNLKDARELYDQESDNIQLLNRAVPINPLPETLVRQIQGVSNENEVNVASVSIGEVALINESGTIKKAGEPGSLPENSGAVSFSLNSTADYLSFFGFLLALEDLQRPVKIDSVTLETNKTNKGRALVLHASGRTPYFIPEP